MIPSCRTLALLSSLLSSTFAACAVDDVANDVADVPAFADDLVIDADLVVAGVAVTFVVDNADVDVVGCVDAGRCSARFGDHAAEIANATVTPGEIIAVVPAGVVSGPACFTVDGVERCAAVDVVSAPVVVGVDVVIEECTCRCAAPTYTSLSIRGAALPVDAVVEVDGAAGVFVGSVDAGGTQVWASMNDALAPGAHTLTVRAPLHGDAVSAAFGFVVR